MKKAFVIALLAAALATYGDGNYKNRALPPSGHETYSFHFVQKVNRLAAVFTVVRHTYTGIKSKKKGYTKESTKQTREKNIIIVNIDFTNTPTAGYKMSLSHGQTLYKIGVTTLPDGRKFEVYSYDRNHKVNEFFRNDAGGKGGSQTDSAKVMTVRCPHCSKMLTVPVK